MLNTKVLVILGLLALSACTTTSNVSTNSTFSGISEQNILLMTPDIKYFRVTASGITEPNADWTETAQSNFNQALDNYTATENLSLLKSNDSEQVSDLLVEYDRLHSAVGSSILAHHYGLQKLPAKAGAFDWSLGSGVKNLASDRDEKYALFVFYRDYQASGGRMAIAFFAAALSTPIYTGHQGGFASLVDLTTGDVIWFNNVAAAAGDMRKPNGAKKIVKQLLTELSVQPQ